MSADNNGGPAFHVQDASKWQAHGMTLRDYLAAKAMQAMVAQRCYPWDKQMPLYAYEVADAMLSARESPK